MKNILASFCLYLICSTSTAEIIEISSLNISGGSVLIGGTTNVALLPGDDPFIRMGDYQGTYDMSSVFGGVVTGNDGTGFPFYGLTLSSDGTTNYSAPMGTVDDTLGTISVDLSSWFAWQTAPSGGVVFNQGGIATGLYDSITGEFTMSWDALIADGTFPDPNTWTLTGTVNTVPLPAGIWLFISGMVALLGFRKRRLSSPDI